MQNINWNLFHRKYGVRLPAQLMTPLTHDLSALVLPLKSLYHHATFDGVLIGPNPDEYVFNGQTKPISIHNLDTLLESKGASRKSVANIPQLNKELINKNRRLRLMRDLENTHRDPATLVVYNYNYLSRIYRYTRAVFTEYHKWYDTFGTLLRSAADIAQRTQYNQFLLCEVPTILPSIAQLNAASGDLSQQLLKVIHEPAGFLLLELWKWLGDDRSNSLFAYIPANKLNFINLLYHENGKWCVLNLGYLDSWRQKKDQKAQAGDADFNVIESSEQYSPEALQKRLLRFMMRMMELRTMTANTTEQLDAEIDVGSYPLDQPAAPDGEPAVVAPLKTLEELDQVDDETGPLETDEERIVRISEEDRQLDEELAQLNDIAMRKTLDDDKDGIVSVKEMMLAPEPTLEEGILAACDKLDASGMITVREYKRFETLGNTYKKAPNPYGNGQTVEEFINVTAEMIHLSPKKLPDSDTIVDKSILNDTLGEFDRKYVKEILPRHVTAMVMNLQRAGIVVQEHTVEKKGSLTGEYEDHTIRLVPVTGAPSTLKFKIPVIDENGVMRANAVNYRLKKLRVDQPIRKLSPEKVALTSYYGKLFITRGRKRAYDYGAWLRSKIMSKALDETDKDITHIIPTNTFDSNLKAPRNYTSISMGYREITARGYTFFFDQRVIAERVDVRYLKKQQSLGNLIVAINEHNEPLVMDALGGVYFEIDNKLTLFGSLEQFLGIDIADAPVEFAEVSIFGKEVPVGILLGYYLGFSNLLRTLGVEPKRFEAGKRVPLGDGEWALVFSDETLVFNRDDRVASMVLGGFKDYHKSIRMFSVHSFDKAGVYLNILEANKLSVRYLREIDLLNQLFIDPITKLLLEKIKEPQTFQGLLLRAVELLLLDYHKHELDFTEQHLRGYERIAGGIYTDLVQSVRQHNAQLGKANKKLELNPYSVWKRVSEDPAKEQMSELNPLKQLRELEAVTFSGEGGRSKQSMVKSTRMYHPNDMGVISESTVDSGDVAINTFMSSAPKLNSLLGTADPFDFEKDGPGALLSTSANCAPGSDRDDQLGHLEP
jgi:hypothetical protein